MRPLLLGLCLSLIPTPAVALRWKGDTSRFIHHIGAEGGGCGERVSRTLRLEDLPEKGILKVVNTRKKAVRLFYDHENFGDYTMFFVRVRDAIGKIIIIDGGSDCGWWSIKSIQSQMFEYGHWPRRRVLRTTVREPLSDGLEGAL
jgi:hypothetical protein